MHGADPWFERQDCGTLPLGFSAETARFRETFRFLFHISETRHLGQLEVMPEPDAIHPLLAVVDFHHARQVLRHLQIQFTDTLQRT